MKKRAYRAVEVKQVVLAEVLRQLPDGKVWVGVDIGKDRLLAVVRGADGEFLKPWKIAQPAEVRMFVETLRSLGEVRPVTIVMESTGTYGDGLRQALRDVRLEARRVRTQAASQFAETFDGVPSQHDGKDAAVLAELGAIGKSDPWPLTPADPWQDQLHVEVQWMEAQQNILQQWTGRLEGLLARHWPEVLPLLKLTSGTLLKVLRQYGGPAPLASDPQAGEVLARLGGRLLKREKLERVLASAGTTLGVRMTEETIRGVRRCAEAAWAARRQIAIARKALKRLLAQQEVLQRMAQVVGPATACVVFDSVGHPRQYDSPPAYRKGLGLNLREMSSGQYQGQLKITKRGPAIARKWLYFAALRWIQRSPLKGWFAARKDPRRRDGTRLVVAVMRRLALALHVVALGQEDFDLGRLFPGRSPTQRHKQRTRPTREVRVR